MSIGRAFPLLCAIFFACSSEKTASPSKEDCEKVRDHLASLQVEKRAGGQAVPESELEKHRENLRASLGDGFLEGCTRGKLAYAECVLDAEDSAAALRCQIEEEGR